MEKAKASPENRGSKKGITHKQRDAELEKSLGELSVYYAKAMPLHQIASKLGICIDTVYSRLKILERRWRESAQKTIDEIKRQDLIKLEVIEQEAWKAWARSQKKDVTETEGCNKEGMFKSKTVRRQAGEHALLEVVLKCIAQRARILGYERMPENWKPSELHQHVHLYNEQAKQNGEPRTIDDYNAINARNRIAFERLLKPGGTGSVAGNGAMETSPAL